MSASQSRVDALHLEWWIGAIVFLLFVAALGTFGVRWTFSGIALLALLRAVVRAGPLTLALLALWSFGCGS